MRRRPPALVMVTLVVAAVGATSVAAVPTPAGAATTIAVKAGYDDAFVPNRSFPVRVTVRPDRLVNGTLRVRAERGGGAASEVHLPVEIPGGSAKEFVVVVPASAEGPGGPVQVTARLLDGGTEVGRSPVVPLRTAGGQELVGLLPGVLGGAPPPGAAPLAVDAGVARFVAVGAAELAHAPASLQPLSALGVADGELAQLSPTSKAGVLRWIAGGGHLLVDSAPGARVEGLPDEWQPGPNGRTAAGHGHVVVTGGAMAAGRWAGLVEPSPQLGQIDGAESGIGQALAADAGLRIPEIGWLLLFLLVYVAVVGPIAAVVLSRMRRPELAWVVIPLAAVVFTSASWAGARGLRSGTRLAHGTVLEMTPGGANATTFVGLAARSRQRTGVGFVDGWTAERAASGFDPSASVVEVTPDGDVARLRLEAGEFDVVRGEGPVAGGGGLELDAVSETDGAARGVVRNRLPYRIEEVVVLVAGAGTSVGALDSGAERSWEVRVPRQPQLEIHELAGIERGLWRKQFRDDPDSVVNLPLWQTTPLGTDPFIRGPGVAVAVGWTREFTPPVVVDGARREPVGRTAVVTTAEVEPGGQALTDLAIRRDVVRSGGGFVRGRRARLVEQGPFALMRFTLPEGSDGRRLVARVPAAGNEVSLWADGRWQSLRVAIGDDAVVPPGRGFAGPGAAAPPVVDNFNGMQFVEVDIPPGAVQRGAVWLRVHTGGGFPWELSGAFTLRERT